MAKISIPCLVSKTSKAGVTSWYWQPSKTLAAANWKPIALGKDEGVAIAAARRRNDEVALWKAGGGRPGEVKKRMQAGTVGALIARYRGEVLNGRDARGKPCVAPSTAKTYETSLKRLELWAGKQPLAFVTTARVKALKTAMLAPLDRGGIGHDPAHKTLKMGRALFAFAIGCDLIERNPFASFGLGAPDPRDVVWSPQARDAMVAVATADARPSLALAIMLGFAIGQREADLLAVTTGKYVAIPAHKMQPEDYATLSALARDGVPRGIRIRQNKTGAWIEVPVVGAVRDAVEQAVVRAHTGKTTMLIQDDARGVEGRAAVYAGEAGQTRFQRDFAELRGRAMVSAALIGETDLAAELAGIQFRDLRRTCVVYQGELGLEDHLIASITGHDIDETRRILKTYMPRTTGRAARAIALSAAREVRDAERASSITAERG